MHTKYTKRFNINCRKIDLKRWYIIITKQNKLKRKKKFTKSLTCRHGLKTWLQNRFGLFPCCRHYFISMFADNIVLL